MLLKVWGGAEPPAFTIAGPDVVSENASIVMNISGAGVVPNGPNVGWWAERISGQVGVQQNGADRNSATIRGVRVGYVRVKAVVGTTTAEKIVKVQASVRPRIIGRGRPILKLQPVPKQP